ncbi:conjugal transfer protein TraK [Hymenobacter sp. 5414T-23]|uniref:conjugal transfer protein TraK n=1 Tax=Hymenobacter sp. 5414T-23 TaxID=2932252 RepID=UPI001FCFAAF3|nr:conjugal transfer protein TraK [Hymenobacter sp. 5414T-23]UOQ83232.1 conjugal transfer protein TraK [Hymenobacter sp. 5414T-23]
MDSAKNLSTSFSTMRNLAMGSVFALLLVSLAAGFLVYRAYENSGRRVYVVGQTGSVAALSAPTTETHTAYEARNLVRNFMLTMFGHDQYTYKTNLDAALPLIEGRGGRRIYDGFTRGQVLQNYERYAARNVVTVDSVSIDMNHRPWSGRVYIKQRIFIGGEQKEPLPLAAKFNLAETNRSDANPYGMLITNFDYIPYNPQVSREELQALKEQEADRQRALLEAQRSAGALAPDAGDSPASPSAPGQALPAAPGK